MTRANCPSCGGPIEFAIGSSAVVVCSYCRSVVARTDRGPEAHGKVAALIETGSPLRTGATGHYRGKGFRITGRTQLRHQAGGVWDEWYAHFDDGAWGWLAEAQGRYYVTFPANRTDLPALAELQLGGRMGDLVVSEIGVAEVASAEGELPWRPTPNETYDYADLTGPSRKFATIDYSEEAPIFFGGYETSLQELDLEGGEAREARVPLVALKCTSCGGPLDLRAPDRTERVFCPNCGAGHDVTEGKLRALQQLKKGKKVEPVIPLGTTGTIDGVAYVVAGFMQRSVKFDITYYWTEYLLFNAGQGFRWLVHSDDHWSFVTPLRAGDVMDGGSFVQYDGKRHRIFQTATARVTYVVGEFYWKVAVGEEVDTTDYVSPPEGISKEVTREGAQEINYSHARYMTPDEVEQAFGVKNLTRPRTVGSMQPFDGPRLIGPWLVMLALLFIVAMVIAATKKQHVLIEQNLDVAGTPAVEGGPANARILFSEPFDVSGTQNVVIEGGAELNNSWMYVAGDLVHEASGKTQSFDLELEDYHGVEDGEAWSEGKSKRRVFVSAPEKGRYVLRFEAQWAEGGTPPAFLHVRVREGVFRWLYFLLAAIAISVLPVLAIVRQIRFESERWSESAFNPYSGLPSSNDDEEDGE